MICGVKKIFDLGIRLIGPLFICLATVLVTGIIVIYFKVLIPFHSDYTDLLGLWNLAIGLWVAPNIYFNYFMCVFTWAGSPDAATEVCFLEFSKDLVFGKDLSRRKKKKKKRAFYYFYMGIEKMCIEKLNFN